MATKRLPCPFTLAELMALGQHAEPGEWAAIVFLVETGLRSFEARSITRDQAEAWPRPGRIFCRHPDAVLRIVGKGDKERTVVLSREALFASRVLLERSKNGHLVPWSERGLRWKLAELGKRAGVHCHPHRARHTFAQQLVEAGVPLQVVADMMGHGNLDITRLYYYASERAKWEALRSRRRWLRR